MDKETQALLGLAIGLGGGTTQEWANAVERAGQSKVVNSEMLPKDMGLGGPPPGFATKREVYEGMGITFGDEVDDIFVKATLPEGWKKVRTDHYMWSKVVDAKGRERISIFYKPEFYDRSAHMDFCNRYGYGVNYSEDGQTLTVYVKDGVQSIQTIGSLARPDNRAGSGAWMVYDAEQKALYAKAKEWLNEHYPDWQNPLAYWD